MQETGMEDEIEVRQMARDALRGNRLPPRRPDRMWGGPGSGQPCAVCAGVVERDQMGFDLEFSSEESAGSPVATRYVHVRCFAAWEFERDAPQVIRGSGDPSDSCGEDPVTHSNSLNGSSLHASTADGTIASRERQRVHSDGGIP
jgi:hypothetical protein